MRHLAQWVKRYGFYLFLGAVLACLGGGVYWLRNRPFARGEAALHAMADRQAETLGDPLEPAQSLSLPEEETVVWSESLQCWTGHAGWDLLCAEGAAVYALHEGTVVQMAQDRFLGNLLRIRSTARETVYAGLANECSLRVGQRVAAGALLGRVGVPGLSEQGATHLHLETYKTAATIPATTSDAQASR